MQSKMAVKPVKTLIWEVGLPMIISMILQAVYNIVDTAFVINMGADGVAGNLALTYAFPVQLLIIAIGVGTGVGISALLSKSLGENDKSKSDKVAGNGIFAAICIYAVFLIFGIFASRPFIAMQAAGDEKVIKMGSTYLTICCTLSFGVIGFTVYERFLQSTGRTLYSTIGQISGAAANIILDYVFIYPLKMGVAGAAWATVAGQILSLAVAMAFHYLKNKEIGNGIKNLIPDGKILKEIYHIGLSAALMQGLLSVMMLGVNLILGTAKENSALLQGSFGIYYKIMQFALFACFGLSNTIIAVLSYNYGMGDMQRSKECVKLGIADTVAVAAVIWALFEIFAVPLANLFGTVGGESGEEIKNAVVSAIRIAGTGYIFMGVSISVQGVLQALRYAVSPLIISLLRLAVLIFPAVAVFILLPDAANVMWWAFPVVEVLTAALSVAICLSACKKKLVT